LEVKLLSVDDGGKRDSNGGKRISREVVVGGDYLEAMVMAKKKDNNE
jgi:hypothetical protein